MIAGACRKLSYSTPAESLTNFTHLNYLQVFGEVTPCTWTNSSLPF